jgi:hypothetical protein
MPQKHGHQIIVSFGIDEKLYDYIKAQADAQRPPTTLAYMIKHYIYKGLGESFPCDEEEAQPE